MNSSYNCKCEQQNIKLFSRFITTNRGPAWSTPVTENGGALFIRSSGKGAIDSLQDLASCFWHATHSRFTLFAKRRSPTIKN